MRQEYREVVTPVREIRRMARRYSSRYGVPIRISAAAVDEVGPNTDAIYHYRYGRNGKVVSTVYLHPDLQYESRAYVDSTIRHELAHLNVEKKWEGRL
ncbi:hypothetical protein LCGC14_1796720 [marine sediment metagenome]|uniref:SprT-like domain-containing protein n=1 Tax=marine sediment metagenome TaxID=412755 RepID=A0A0F9HDI6_9ZZZZ